MTTYEQHNEIKIKVGDKVIDACGRQGKVTEYDAGDYVTIQWEDDYEWDYPIEELESYYLVGNQVIGNKCQEADLLKDLERIDNELARLQSQKRQLKKQLWRWHEVMVPDWKERQANKKKLPPSED